jgi:hypothetical protein
MILWTYGIGASAKGRSITCNCNACNRDILFGNQLVRTIVFSQIPYPDTASAITANDLALIGMDNYIVHRTAVGITSLDRTTPSFPDLDCAILRACDHPFSLAVKCDSRNVSSVTFECEERIRVRGFDVVEFHGMVTRSCEKALVGGDTEPVDLRV